MIGYDNDAIGDKRYATSTPRTKSSPGAQSARRKYRLIILMCILIHIKSSCTYKIYKYFYYTLILKPMVMELGTGICDFR